MAKRFAGAMSAFANGIGLSPSFLVNGYPWSSVGNGTGTVVDVGGSKGNISVALARSAQKLHFVVQDLPSTIDGAKDILPDDVADRIEFMAHDMFTEQPLKADVYLFRNIFHNWSDSHVIKILQAAIPALKPGACIVVNDYVIPEPKSVSPSKERDIRYISNVFIYWKLLTSRRSMDMVMFSVLNAREREVKDWQLLLQQADDRFGDVRVWTPEGATLAIIETIWKG